jgi:hypothetical protein
MIVAYVEKKRLDVEEYSRNFEHVVDVVCSSFVFIRSCSVCIH